MKHCLQYSFTLLLIFYISANSLKAQHTVTGKVLDDKGKPIDYASVVLQVDGKNDVKYDITNEKGKFAVNDVKKGTYKLYIQYFSKDIYTDTIKVAGDLELGNITAKSGFALLDEVVKTSKKPMIEQKVDRLVFNASSSIAASDGSALDALKKTPMVNVKQDKISLMGKGSVAILINDRIVRLSGEDLVSYLESVSSVKSIEVITTPPAKYEAEGSGGLINIVLKKGLLNHWSNSTRTSYKQATYPYFSVGNTFNYSKNKFSISANINGHKGKRLINIINYDIFFPNAKNKGRIYSKDSKNSYSGHLGLDYKLGKNASIGGIFKIWHSLNNIKDNTNINIKDDNNRLTSQIVSNGISKAPSKNITGNLHYSQKLDTMGRGFSVDLSYFKYKSSIDRILKISRKKPYYILKEKDNIKNTGSQEIENYSVKLDFEHPTSWANITYGGKLSYSNTDNNNALYNLVSGNYISDPKQADHFNYKENRHALYFDIAKNIGEKWQCKIGLRYEHTLTVGNSVKKEKSKRSYRNFFPTTYIKYYPNEHNNISLKYNRRIRRPGFWDLNPFKWNVTSTIYSEGNPKLQPSFTDKIEATHEWKNKLFTTVYAELTSNGFGQIMDVDATSNTQKYTRENFYRGYSLGLYEYYTFNPFSWWESVNKFYIFYKKNIFYEQYKSKIPPAKGLWSSRLYTSNSFTLNHKKTLLGEIGFYYYSPSIHMYMSTEAKYNLNIALKVYLLQRRLTVALSVNDIFKTSSFNFVIYTRKIKQFYNIYNDSRYIKLTLRYSFGNNKIKVKTRKFGNEEESQRININ